MYAPQGISLSAYTVCHKMLSKNPHTPIAPFQSPLFLQEVLLPSHGIQLVIRQRPGGAQVTQGSHVFEPGSERRVPGIRTPTGQFTESAQDRFGQAGDTGLGQQHSTTILRPLVEGAQRAFPGLTNEPGLLLRCGPFHLLEGPQWATLTALPFESLPGIRHSRIYHPRHHGSEGHAPEATIRLHEFSPMPRPGHTHGWKVRKLKGMTVGRAHAMPAPRGGQFHASTTIPGYVTYLNIKEIGSCLTHRHGLRRHERGHPRAAPKMLEATDTVLQGRIIGLCRRCGLRDIPATAGLRDDGSPP